MSHFKVKANRKLSELKLGDRVEESDFATITPDGNFVQLEYIETDETDILPYDVKPGIWTIQKILCGLKLEKTSFTHDAILEDLVNTKDITSRVDKFFAKLDVYKKYGIEVPRRALLLWGPPGSGKSTSITKVAENYVKDGETAIIIWPTDKFEAYTVKDFIKSFNYVGVKKLILIVEDIGGVEIDQTRMKSDSSLLSLLDNKEKIFKLPVCIIATTNFPENFLGNLTNRPGRFDDKIEVGTPNGEGRKKLLKFYLKDEVAEEEVEKISEKRYAQFSPAHIQEIVIRAAIYDMTLKDSMESILKEIIEYTKNFSGKKGLGIGTNYHDEE